MDIYKSFLTIHIEEIFYIKTTTAYHLAVLVFVVL